MTTNKRKKDKHCCPRCGSTKDFIGGIALVFYVIGHHCAEWAQSIEISNRGYCKKCAYQLEEHITQWWRNR